MIGSGDMMKLVFDDRGIAMTEGVIVIPFFIVIWVGLVALFHLFSGRLEAQVDAGAVAMKMAASGDCGDADLSMSDMEETSAIDTGMESSESSMIESVAGCQPFAWSHAKVTVDREVSGIPAAAGGPTSTVSAKRSLMCNMKPVDGLLDMVAQVVSEALGLNDEEE